MGTRRSWLVRFIVFTAVGVLVALTSLPASADPVSDAVTDLGSSAVYVDPGARINGKSIDVDEDKVASAGDNRVKVAILPDGQSTTSAGNSIANQLPAGNFALAVFSGNKFDADSNFICTGYPRALLRSVASSHSGELNDGQYTDTLVEFARRVVDGPKKGTSACSNGGSAVVADDNNKNSGGSAWPWVAGIAGLGAAGGGYYALRKRRRQRQALQAAGDNVTPYYDRLANEVNTINPAGDPKARQAMADASERFTAAGSIMASATTVEQWAAARRATLEGLQAAKLARTTLGLPEGPEIPPIDEPRGERLTSAQEVTVGNQRVQGYPDYQPGAPYYYGGGAGYGAGWYSTPFWETLLIGSVLTGGLGGFGGGWGGGGYGYGYGSGYEAGRDSAQNDGGNDANSGGNNDAGSWGGFGDGGGGGWGGFGGGGGGDFGGGGGGGDGGSF
ncbi:MAG: hypothetical protein ABJA87_13945 [bacterium]